ncbi:MAG: sel1 repeat family protein, partial [Lentisphaeria bacterium]|nr:sel1 repeat family protein [Lentisphaeria bacterium]
MKKFSFLLIILCISVKLAALDLAKTVKLAESGNIEAQFKLGEYYGDSTQKHYDAPKSFVWYKKAAEQGDIPAKRRLGNCYIMGSGVAENPDKAAALWSEAAQAGDRAAAYNLAKFYHGNGGPVKP